MPEDPGSPPGGELLLAWSAADLRLRSAGGPGRRIDVADSWLVDSGMARGLQYHAERFTESCWRQHAVDPAVTSEFLAAAGKALPVTGQWFPRVEFEAGAGLRLLLRPAPAARSEVILRGRCEPDSRSMPAVKGPDLDMLTNLRRGAAAAGADEVLMVSRHGTVLEGALSAMLWWRGSVLCVPPPGPAVLPSITRRLLLEIASATGTEVRFETCRADDLDGTEIWTASALHGIRPVTAWTGGRLTVLPPRRAAAWQVLLTEKAVPVDTVRLSLSFNLRG